MCADGLNANANGNGRPLYLRQYLPRWCPACGERLYSNRTERTATRYYCRNADCSQLGRGRKFGRPAMPPRIRLLESERRTLAGGAGN